MQFVPGFPRGNGSQPGDKSPGYQLRPINGAFDLTIHLHRNTRENLIDEVPRCSRAIYRPVESRNRVDSPDIQNPSVNYVLGQPLFTSLAYIPGSWDSFGRRE